MTDGQPEKAERTKPANRWPQIVKHHIAEIIIQVQQLPVKHSGTPNLDTLLEMLDQNAPHWTTIRGDPGHISHLVEQAAAELAQAEFHHTWHPNQDRCKKG